MYTAAPEKVLADIDEYGWHCSSSRRAVRAFLALARRRGVRRASPTLLADSPPMRGRIRCQNSYAKFHLPQSLTK